MAGRANRRRGGTPAADAPRRAEVASVLPESESRPEAIAAADLLPPKLGPVERAMRLAYAKGVSARTLVRPFRKPARLRLLTTVAEPVPGERTGGMALRAGHFLIAGKRVSIDGADYSGRSLAPPIAQAIHRFDWLPDLESAGTRDKVAPVAEDILRRWLLVNHEVGEGPAWTAGSAGARLLAWLIHAPLILSGGDKAFRASLLRHMAATASWLDRRVKKAMPARDSLPAWTAITAAGLLLPDGKPRRLYGEAGLISALGDAVGEDGGMLSRRPLDQLEAIILLLRLAACYRACRHDPPPQLQSMLSLLTPALLSVTHADGSLGSWQGAPPLSGKRIAALTDLASPRARPLREAHVWGYQRLCAGDSVLQFDSAPPPAGPDALGGCASTLAVEFSHGEQRIIVNCGGSALAGGGVPMRIRDGLRGTAAHSTLVLHDADSTLVLDDGQLGQGVRAVEFERDDAAEGQALHASHDGYLARFGLVHERQLSLTNDGLVLQGIDALVPKGRKARKGPHPFAICFHLGQGIEIEHALHGGGVTLSLPDGSFWQFRSPDVPVTIEDSLWVDATGHPRTVKQLLLIEEVDREGGAVRWSLSRAG